MGRRECNLSPRSNDMVISTSSGKHRHVVVEVEWDGVSAICHRRAEVIDTF